MSKGPKDKDAVTEELGKAPDGAVVADELQVNDRSLGRQPSNDDPMDPRAPSGWSQREATLGPDEFGFPENPFSETQSLAESKAEQSELLQRLKGMVESFRTQLKPSTRAITGVEEQEIRDLRSMARSYRAAREAILDKSEASVDSGTAAKMLIFHLNPGAELISAESGVITFQLDSWLGLPELPADYGYKGGAARYALLELLNQSTLSSKPRDLDIVRLGSEFSEFDDQLAATLSPEDHRTGNSVELVADFKDYFATRDLSINEVLWANNQLACTYLALEDLINRRLRPTSHVTDQTGRSLGLIAMKMIRLKAEAELAGDRWEILAQGQNSRVTPFDIALHLQRALERGEDIAKRYLELAASVGYIYHCETILEGVELLEKMERGVTAKLPWLSALRHGQSQPLGEVNHNQKNHPRSRGPSIGGLLGGKMFRGKRRG